MKSGLLWYDASAAPLDRKIADAAARYQKKYGIAPNTCHVNPLDLAEFAKDRDPLTYKMPCKVMPNRNIIRNNIWVGVEK